MAVDSSTPNRAARDGAESAAVPVTPASAVSVGGDPACWLDRVCAECGRFVDDAFADSCPSCGSPR